MKFWQKLFGAKQLMEHLKTAKNYTLGYHEIGKFHYFTIFSHDNFYNETRTLGLIKSDKTYKTFESFQALIVSVHENYHTMQSSLLGLCNWFDVTQDNFASNVAQLVKQIAPQELIKFPLLNLPVRLSINIDNDILNADNSNSFACAKAALYERWFVKRLIYSSEFTEMLLRSEITANQELANTFPPDMFKLNSQDLLECHAAILTEFHISRLIKINPIAFDESIVKDMSSSFRVQDMPEYNRPLRIFRQMTQCINFGTANRQHPLYPQCEHGAELGLLLFILDIALHVPPKHLIISKGGNWDTSAKEDINPACRFLKLLAAYSTYLIEISRKGLPIYLEHNQLYSLVSNELVSIINKANREAREQIKKNIEKEFHILKFLQKEVEELTKLLNIPDNDTFLDFNSTTFGWLSLYQNHNFRTTFSRIYKKRIKALEIRISNPEIFYDLNPLAFYGDVGLCPYFKTPKGFEIGMPSLKIKKDKIDERVIKILEKQVKELEQNIKDGVKIDHGKIANEIKVDNETVVEFAGPPYGFVDEFVIHEIFIAISEMLFYRGKMKCPLTTTLDCYPCKSRNSACRNIVDTKRLPLKDCLTRNILEQFFCSAERLSNQGYREVEL